MHTSSGYLRYYIQSYVSPISRLLIFCHVRWPLLLPADCRSPVILAIRNGAPQALLTLLISLSLKQRRDRTAETDEGATALGWVIKLGRRDMMREVRCGRGLPPDVALVMRSHPSTAESSSSP